MSATHAPEPEGRPDRDDRRDATPRPVAAPLTDRDREILDRIAGFENGSDPVFVARLNAPPAPATDATAGTTTGPAGGLGRDRIIQIVVVLGLLALLLPGPWLLVAAFLVGPAIAAFFGLRTARRAARTMKPPAA
ncbi:hypothetical protein EV383_4047 [Pseudonocardia sediminis]|uniref:DUF3040 family protein n=1 Tax=Pseudonocardia sediminis TaxID=1397368 RepID=A0A4Q7V3H3_PSEST|nr:hypothetical protein [Pseudonocardia sediminis]RZT87139.1 hypothetical protein EV383_4047 [Pseudonocardia sediminis]